MNPREIVNMALTASSVAESEGFKHTAYAFAALAAATSLTIASEGLTASEDKRLSFGEKHHLHLVSFTDH